MKQRGAGGSPLANVQPEDPGTWLSDTESVITVLLPLPPRECHQNRSGRFGGLRDEMRAKAAARDFAYATVLAIHGEDAPRFWPEVGPCVVDVLFRFPDRRRRDLANYLGAIKPYFDGMTLANVWRDDSLICDLRVRRTIDREDPGVVIRVWPVAPTGSHEEE